MAADDVLDTSSGGRVPDGHALPGVRPLECGSHSGPRWYVVQTHRGAERLAVLELANQDFPTLLPLRCLAPKPDEPSGPRRHRRREAAPRIVPAFPGYLFVLFDQAAQPWRRIHGTRGVRRLFSTSPERPTPVPVGVVERLMAKLSAQNIADVPLSEAGDPVPDGAIVTVLSGPFVRQQAICIRSAARNTVVVVRLLTLGWDVELPRSEVRVEDDAG